MAQYGTVGAVPYNMMGYCMIGGDAGVGAKLHDAMQLDPKWYDTVKQSATQPDPIQSNTVPYEDR